MDAVLRMHRPASTQLPIEIWERAIDHLWADVETLKACTLVCRLWTPRSRFHLLGKVVLDERKQVCSLMRVARASAFHAEAVSLVVIRGGKSMGESNRRPIPHLGTFAAMAARKLNSLKRLAIWNGKWEAGSMHPDVLLHLFALTSVTELTLIDVTFPSPVVFGQLLNSLPNLEYLECQDVTFSLPTYDAGFFKKCPPKKLSHLLLTGSAASIGGVVDFLVYTSIAVSLKYICLGNSLHKPVYMQDVTTTGSQRLLQTSGRSLQTFSFTVVDSDRDAADAGIMSSPVPLLNLMHNSCMEYLWLRTRFGARGRTDYTWIYSLISRISSTKLRAISLRFDLYRQEPHEILTLDDVLKIFDSRHYALIDDTLSTDQYASLMIIGFWLRLRADARYAVPIERQWHTQLVLRFPKLHARGVVLHARIYVPNQMDFKT